MEKTRLYKVAMNDRYGYYYRVARKHRTHYKYIAKLSSCLDSALEGITSVMVYDKELAYDDFRKVLDYAYMLRERFDNKYDV